MKNTIKLLFTIILLLAISNVKAQSHTFAPGWCKLAKAGGVKGESASLECQACNAKDKKEIEAKAAENKRRDDAIVAKAKAEREAFENARLEKLRLAEVEAKRIKNEKVVIDLPKYPVDTKKSLESKKDKNVTDNTIMKAGGWWYNEPGKFVNEKNEIIIENKEWKRTESLCGVNQNCPKNLGLVWILYKDYDNNRSPPGPINRMDIVNSKGVYLFNDNNIRGISYLNDGWLLIDAHPVETYLYNLDTKKKIIINNLVSEVNYDWGHGVAFAPIFADVDNVFKKNLYSRFNSQINDDILRKYSFTLIHGDRLFDEYDTFWKQDKLVLFCVTKNGELTKIDLK